MVSVKWEAGSDSNVMTTELNSLADDANAVSSEIDNNAEYLFDDVEWPNAKRDIGSNDSEICSLFCPPICPPHFVPLPKCEIDWTPP